MCPIYRANEGIPRGEKVFLCPQMDTKRTGYLEVLESQPLGLLGAFLVGFVAGLLNLFG